MEQNKLTVRQGATLSILWENDETGADTARITLTQLGVEIFTKEVNFIGLVADLSLTADETELLELGEYDYMVTLVYEDGTVEKYPDVSGCSDCTLPILTVCLANDVEGS